MKFLQIVCSVLEIIFGGAALVCFILSYFLDTYLWFSLGLAAFVIWLVVKLLDHLAVRRRPLRNFFWNIRDDGDTKRNTK